MFPLLKNGEHLNADYSYYRINKVKKDDIVLVKITNHKNLIIKKIYAIAGDKFKLKFQNSYCEVYINQKRIKNSKGKNFLFNRKRCLMLKLYATSYPIIPKNNYLIFGEQLGGTLDSSKFGLIDRKSIKAKVFKITK